MRVTIITAIAIAILTAGCSSTDQRAGVRAGDSSTAAPSSSTTSAPPRTTAPRGPGDPDYSSAASWLCRPEDTTDACHAPLDATLVRADGSTAPDPFVPATDPDVDCFYVYPTVSNQRTPNSDMTIEVSQRGAATLQFARFRSECRPYAPMYRQLTVKGLALQGGQRGDGELAYGDVRAAFEDYLARDNRGRGFILVGHSQGSGHLTRLIKELIDPDAALRAQLVSAVLMGTSVTVPDGAATGGSFANVPVCRKAAEAGCVLTFSTFDARQPPNGTSLFGRTVKGVPSACTNPGGLDGGSHPVISYVPARSDAGATTPVTTPYVRYEGLLTATCAREPAASYLSVAFPTDPADRRPKDLGGRVGPGWGLHLLDANLAQGSLLQQVTEQIDAYRKRR